MSSGTASNPEAARRDAIAVGRTINKSAAPRGLGMTNRQVALNRQWSFYRAANYEGRSVDWNGNPVLEHIETEAVVQGQSIPPGFYDVGQQYPLKMRRPTAPYYLARIIVNRFTGLLFSQRRHPEITVMDDPETEAWLRQFADDTRLWSQMIATRTFGGAMGTVAIGFKFVNGKPKIEVFDPRWCFPEFSDPEENELSALEVRYQYPLEVRNEDGDFETRWFWYRRVIDARIDTVWPKVPVEEGDEPVWEKHSFKHYPHDFGFCPVVWVQNIPVKNDPNGDGDPDCHGVYDSIEAIDALISQANRGTLANSDPTLVLASDSEWLGGVKKGSENAMHIEKGASATYLEITGAGPKAARELASELKEQVLEMSRCVLDETIEKAGMTATEVKLRYASMFEQADMLREQYGEAIKQVLSMVLRATRALDRTRVEKAPGELPTIVRRTVTLAPRVEIDPETKRRTVISLSVGSGERVDLRWPEYFDPNLDDVEKAVRAAGAAKGDHLIDAETATLFIAKQFQISDVKAAMAKIEEGRKAEQEQSGANMMGAMSGF